MNREETIEKMVKDGLEMTKKDRIFKLSIVVEALWTTLIALELVPSKVEAEEIIKAREKVALKEAEKQIREELKDKTETELMFYGLIGKVGGMNND